MQNKSGQFKEQKDENVEYDKAERKDVQHEVRVEW